MSFSKTQIIIGIVVVIMVTILMPVDLQLSYIPYIDKVAHVTAACIMTLALAMVLSIRKAILITFLLFTGAEFLQYYLPNRGMSLGDFVANTAGILGAWIIHSYFRLTILSKYIKLPS